MASLLHFPSLRFFSRNVKIGSFAGLCITYVDNRRLFVGTIRLRIEVDTIAAVCRWQAHKSVLTEIFHILFSTYSSKEAGILTPLSIVRTTV